jgi:hypothetical protein
MKRTLFVVVALVAFATAASGATISVVSNKLTYNPGETITLTVSGDSQGAKDNAVFGQLEYSAALTDTVTSSQSELKGGTATFTTGNLGRGDGFAEVFDQLNGTAANVTVSTLLASTATLVAQAAGIVTVNWSASPGLTLDFFGLSNTAAGGTVPDTATTFTIIPEPATAALLGLGMLGLVLGGRRRS